MLWVKEMLTNFGYFYRDMPGGCGILDLEAGQVGPTQAFPACRCRARACPHACVCVRVACAHCCLVLSLQTQEAPLPPEAAVLLGPARGAAEGAAHAG